MKDDEWRCHVGQDQKSHILAKTIPECDFTVDALRA